MGISIRPFKDKDRAALLELWQRALPLDALTVDRLESRVLLDENFNARTFLLASEGTQTVGFVLGMTSRRMPLGDADPDRSRCWITALGVVPEDRYGEIGGALLAALEGEFRSQGKRECLVSTYPPGYFTPGVDGKAYPALSSFLQAEGYAVEKEALSMDASIVLFTIPQRTVDLEQSLKARGIRIRVYEREDLLSFLAFLEATMPTDWVRVERANLRSIPSGGFHPWQITVATTEEEIIGYCQFEGSHFGPFGVSDAYQGQGIGTVILARTIERMRDHGFHDAWVMWTDDLAAKVYAKFGFRETRRFSILKKSL